MRTEIVEIRCDRCGNKMEDPHTFEVKNAFGPSLAIERLTDQWRYIDLCPKCKDSLIEWWRNK